MGCVGRRVGKAELEERAEAVGNTPVLDDAVVFDPQGVEDVRAHGAPGRGVAHKGAVVGTGAGHAQPDGVVVDGRSSIYRWKSENARRSEAITALTPSAPGA